MNPWVTGALTLATALIGAVVVIVNVNRTLRHQAQLERERWEKEDAWRRMQLKVSVFSDLLAAAAEAQLALSLIRNRAPLGSEEKLVEAASRLGAGLGRMMPMAAPATLEAAAALHEAFSLDVSGLGVKATGVFNLVSARAKLAVEMRRELGFDVSLSRRLESIGREISSALERLERGGGARPSAGVEPVS